MCIRDSLVDAWAPWQPLTGVNAARNFAAIIIPACGYGVSFLGAEEDVYKRQAHDCNMKPFLFGFGSSFDRVIQKNTQHSGKSEQIGGKFCDFLRQLEGNIPVSYTHLDVYKRQV